MAALDELQGCPLKSSVDIKAGFNNVKLLRAL